VRWLTNDTGTDSVPTLRYAERARGVTAAAGAHEMGIISFGSGDAYPGRLGEAFKEIA